MKQLILALLASCLCGCANIHGRLIDQSGGHREPYECTQNAVAFCTFITVPQVLGPEKFEWHALNIVTVPIGLCCFIIDVPLGFVCDTLCWPYDYYQTSKKKEDEDIK